MLVVVKIFVLLISFWLISAQAQELSEQAPYLTGSQQAEIIIQQCKSPRWKLYDNDPNLKNYFYLDDILKEEIACKENLFFESLNTIIPDQDARKKVLQAFHEYKTHFLNLYRLIATNNLLCDETWPKCGTLGELSNTRMYDSALNHLIFYTLERQDWTY